jgi:cyanophycinase
VSRRRGPKGSIILIGGAEDKEGERNILREVAKRARAGPLVVCTAGSSVPYELFNVYRPIFRGLGIRVVTHVAVPQRESADAAAAAEVVRGAKAFFFTGGDQLRITSNIAGSRLYRAIVELYAEGGTIAGTSAGASALGQTMPVSTVEDEHRVAAASQLLPGMGLIPDVIVDQHFAQRGRMGRLIAGVAENPRLLGIGIDENTALVWQRGCFEVLGAGAVYVVDGSELTASNVAEAPRSRAMSAFDLRLHVLSAGDGFDGAARRPIRPPR